MTTFDVQQEVLSEAPNMFVFPGDEGYEGDEYERLRQESGASNGTELLNMLGVDEVNEDLQQMNNSQLEGEDEVEEEEEECTKTGG